MTMKVFTAKDARVAVGIALNSQLEARLEPVANKILEGIEQLAKSGLKELHYVCEVTPDLGVLISWLRQWEYKVGAPDINNLGKQTTHVTLVITW